MKSSIEVQTLFYSNLGKLFYAIAAADKNVTDEEIKCLKQMINTDWLFLEGIKDKTEVNAMRQLKITFDQLRLQKQNARDCIAEFKLFKQMNENLFTDNIKQLIWKTANLMASSFARRNKSELVMIAELSNILQQK